MVYYDGQAIANSVVYAGIGNFIIQKLKSSALIPFINKETYWINRGLALFTATIAAIGIDYSYHYDPSGTFTLTITGLTITAILASAKQWAFHYMLQQGIYHSITKEKY